jgi:hypothetical protein
MSTAAGGEAPGRQGTGAAPWGTPVGWRGPMLPPGARVPGAYGTSAGRRGRVSGTSHSATGSRSACPIWLGTVQEWFGTARRWFGTGAGTVPRRRRMIWDASQMAQAPSQTAPPRPGANGARGGWERHRYQNRSRDGRDASDVKDSLRPRRGRRETVTAQFGKSVELGCVAASRRHACHLLRRVCDTAPLPSN